MFGAVVAGGGDKQHVVLCSPALISSSSVCEKPPPPQLFDSTRTFAAVPRTLLRLDRELDRVDRVGRRCRCRSESRNFSAHHAGRPVDAGDADAVVAARAPIVPDTWVPWIVIVHRIAGVGDRVEAVRAGRAGDRHAADRHREARAGADQMFAARSGWL